MCLVPLTADVAVVSDSEEQIKKQPETRGLCGAFIPRPDFPWHFVASSDDG